MTGSASIIAAGSTQVWVVSSGALYKWNGSGWVSQSLPSGVSTVTSVSVGKIDDNPWVIDGSGNLYYGIQ
jgi:hypothetical protein